MVYGLINLWPFDNVVDDWSDDMNNIVDIVFGRGSGDGDHAIAVGDTVLQT